MRGALRKLPRKYHHKRKELFGYVVRWRKTGSR